MRDRAISGPATKSSLVRKIFLLFVMLAAPGLVRAQVGGLPGPQAPPPPPPPQLKDQTHAGIRVSTDLVLLHVTVMDERGQFVPGLKQNNFRVFEDKVEQKISAFLGEDVPVTMGLVIDNSGSMREKRSQVNAAALTFIKTSNPQDEVFVVNFNDEYYLDLDKDFTNDQRELNEALSRIDARGSTALFDAVIGSLDHLRKGHKDKKVLLVITDGGDTVSKVDYKEAVRAAQQAEAILYCIIVVPIESSAGRDTGGEHALIQLSEDTGGKYFYATSVPQLDDAFRQISDELRTQYLLAYYPSQRLSDSDFRRIQVVVAGLPADRFKVRHRTGYYTSKSH